MGLREKLLKLLADDEKKPPSSKPAAKPTVKPTKPVKESREIEAAKKQYSEASKRLRELRKNSK